MLLVDYLTIFRRLKLWIVKREHLSTLVDYYLSLDFIKCVRTAFICTTNRKRFIVPFLLAFVIIVIILYMLKGMQNETYLL